MFVISCLVAIIAIPVWYCLTARNPEPKAGVYRQPGRWYWVKRLVFYLIFRLRASKKVNQEVLLDVKKGNNSKTENILRGYGRGHRHTEMEWPQVLSNSPSAIDCCYFGATDKNGCKIVCRLARRKDRRAEIWLFLDVPGIGYLQHPRHPDTDISNTKGTTFQAGGLSFEVLEPMKRWRVSFAGKLRKGLCNDVKEKAQEYVETSFSFIWSAFAPPFNTDTDMSISLLGDSMAREKWSRNFFHRLKSNHQSHYDQWGELRGRLCVEGHEEKQLNLQCVRDHSFGERDWRQFHRYILNYIYVETGMCIQVGIVSQPSLMSHLKLGHIVYANGDVAAVTDVQLNLWEVGEDTETPPTNWKFSFNAGGQRYDVQVEAVGVMPVWYHHEDRGGKVMEMFSTFQVNAHKARGISEFFYRNQNGPSFEMPPPCPLVQETPNEIIKGHTEALTLMFESAACSSPLLVGGKGAQLAELTGIQSDVNSLVPPGFCVTLRAFEKQLQSCVDIENAIGAISSAAFERVGDLQSACSFAEDLISRTALSPDVSGAILNSLETSQGLDNENTRFAVRSSAAGEDGCEASSAGQMETLLGVIGFEQIEKAVRRCWASAYSMQAVEYRRQHGQPIKVLVGVVIQKMVPAQSAGVMFTSDPISGSSSTIVINANYGLGESVVSGRSDPDTIRVSRDPEFLYDTEKLWISQSKTGDKSLQIVQAENGGVMEKSVSDNTESLCLTNELILKLAALGLELEKRYGSPRDIEWAIVDDTVYLLQCRPITVADMETESDLLHEFDSPMTCDYQWLTTANISEMMPGAVTPLTLSTFKPAIELSLQTMSNGMGARRVATKLPKNLPSFRNHLFISLIEVQTVLMSAMMARKDSTEISLLGNLLPEMTMEQIQNYYGRRESSITRFLNCISMFRMLYKSASKTSAWEKRLQTYEVGTQTKNALDLYKSIDAHLPDYEDVWFWTMINSARSGSWANILMSVIGADAGGNNWTNDHCGDFALLLSQCADVYSAEVPLAMERIAKEIEQNGAPLVEKFLETPDDLCLNILKEHPGLDRMVTSFLERHGHRCLRESELREKSWKSAPEKFVSVIKLMLRTKSFKKTKKPQLTITELLDQMKTKLTRFQRFILKKLLPKAWAAVGDREWGKSISIQMSEIFKLAYARLAALLHQEGRLPDSDLMYFLTHQEIGTLLLTRSARLIIKAQRRRKVLSVQQEQKYDKINKSRPIPVQALNVSLENDMTECLKGMAVSQGEVVGPAQVVHSLQGASVIKAGDILVVKSTDVGWSPYFPLIGGLVTELGGLISHGAVVAREYGIPCVVNVANATSIIKTGERLKLEGRQGLVKRLDVQTNAQ